MKHIMYILLFSGIFFSIPECVHAQQEESAEISLEENKDEFQEYFFEALKQRGIENYDRAIDALLKCEKIESTASIDFELGKNYFSRKEYGKAEDYFQKAIRKKPQNQWYLLGLFNVQLRMGEDRKAIKTGKKIALLKPKFREDLVKVYINMGEDEKALELLSELEKEGGLSPTATRLKQTAMRYVENAKKNKVAAVIQQTPKPKKNQSSHEVLKIEGALKSGNYEDAKNLSLKALNDYPSQPRLYLYNAKALSALKENKKAIEMLEIGLDYVFEDPGLEKEFYQTFVVIYKQMGNSKKEDFYRKKAL